MNYSGKWKNVLIIVGTAGVVYAAFYWLLPLVVPFVFAFVFARMLRPVVEKLHEKARMNEKAAAVILVVICVGAVGSFLFYIFYLCAGQLTEVLRSMPQYMGACGGIAKKACAGVDNLLGLRSGEAYIWVEKYVAGVGGKISQVYIPRLTGYLPGLVKTLGRGLVGFVVFLMATLLISFDTESGIRYRGLLPYIARLKKTGLAYLKAQGVIIFLVAAVCAVGLFLAGCPYAVLLGLTIGVVDAFPVVGSGCILVPWAIVKLVQQDFYQGAVLLTIYLIALVLREVLEPRLMGKEMGLKPLYVLISVYVGMQLFGIGGIVLGPVGLTILKTVAETKIKE